jgi:prevent-host-death family protein
MASIGAFDAKTHLAALLDRVVKGEQITITRHGTPVAMLVPVAANRRPAAREAAARLRELRRGITLGDLSVRTLIDQGRR